MNSTILITGSTRGIGLETAKQLLQKGHIVFISGRNEKKLNETVNSLREVYPHAESLLMDISDAKSIEKAAATFAGLKIKLNAIINNAAILPKEDEGLITNSFSLIEKVINTNCYGPLSVARAFLPLMHSPGRIVNISSGGGSMTDPVGGWAPAYCISKTMLNAITRQLAHELSDRNIAVNSLCPGWVRTDMGGKNATRSVEHGAETPVWLATEASQKLTGKFFRDKKEIPW